MLQNKLKINVHFSNLGISTTSVPPYCIAAFSLPILSQTYKLHLQLYELISNAYAKPGECSREEGGVILPFGF